MAERLYIVDGHGYVFRAHYGLMNVSRGERKEVRLSTSEGMPTGALYVFSRMLLRLEEDNAPKRMVVVFDDKSGRKTFRAEMFADYKANRKDMPEELTVQMEYFPKIVRGLGWPCMAVPGVEADDVIATLVVEAKKKGWEVVIYSADKDIMQLIGDGVTMIDALHQKTYTRDEVIKKMGVPPEQIPDFLAIVGDTSDNIPGLRGAGDKTAATLLAQYGSLEALIAANPVIPRSQAAVRRSGAARAREAVAPAGRAEARRRRCRSRSRIWSSASGTCRACMQLFTELEFGLLVDKVKMKMPPSDDATVVPAPEATPLAHVEQRTDTRVVVRARGDRGARGRGSTGGTDGGDDRAVARADRSRVAGRGGRRGAGRGAGVRSAGASLHRCAGAAAGGGSRAAARGARGCDRSRRSPTTPRRSCARSRIAGSPSRASPRTRCSRPSCSIRRPRPSPVRRSSSGSAA